ncbi:hypothetical protein VNO80_11797 [Phaseolus coccineus]|uniref:Uncharacterized protein n=1 Tax=Phaseolus coccineus TaxID=3886 RepID=A0AAN9RKS5_PHACN
MRSDFNQVTLKLPTVPLCENIRKLGIRQATHVLQHVVSLRDELHISVFDSVVDHLHEVPRASLANVCDARSVLDLRRDFVKDVVDIVVGGLRTAGHEGGPVARAVFPAGDAHAKVEETFFGDLADAAFGVLVPLVAAVNDAVARLEVVGECGDGLVDGGAGLDKDDDGSGALEGQDEFTRVTEMGKPFSAIFRARFCPITAKPARPMRDRAADSIRKQGLLRV